MSSIAKMDGTVVFSYYDRRGQKETIRLRQGNDGGLVRDKADGSQEALYRLEGISSAPIPCENYNELKNSMAASPTIG